MDDNFDTRDTRESGSEGQGPGGKFWLGGIALILLIGAAATGMYYSYQQKNTINQLTAQTSSMNSTIGQLQSQLDTTAAKLNDMSSAQAAAAQAAAAQAASNAAKPTARTTAASRAEATRMKQMQSRLDDQQKQLQSTQDSVAQTRTDLQGNLDSTRDQLNGSIAKTHDELVTLEKRGEHRYFEFDLTKAKQFMREGPVSLMVRRSDPKHSNIDMTVLVNDKQITKKKVNLYEPVWIYETDGAEPLQVVVNKIDAKSVHGYVTAPRYSAQDLSASATPAPDATTAAPAPTAASPTTTSPSDSNNNAIGSTAGRE